MINQKLFIDAGSNRGQGFSHFKKSYPLNEYDYYLIEPNPKLVDQLKTQYSEDNRIKIFQNALYKDNSILPLYGRENGLTQYTEGNTLTQTHNTGYNDYTPTKLIDIECIDVKELLETAHNQYENILMKLDIEASEYDVLERMIETETFKYISEIWVEWHTQYMDSKLKQPYIDRENNIRSVFKSHGIHINNWR
jgi:FkbM family methyltransferase